MLKGKRRMKLYMPIDLHEEIKTLTNAANSANPGKSPMTQGDVAVILLRGGIEALYKSNAPGVGVVVKDGVIIGEHAAATDISVVHVSTEKEKDDPMKKKTPAKKKAPAKKKSSK